MNRKNLPYVTQSAYALACGHVQQFESAGVRVTLWKEFNTYHTRAYNSTNCNRLAWESWELLKDARRAFGQYIRSYTKGVES